MMSVIPPGQPVAGLKRPSMDIGFLCSAANPMETATHDDQPIPVAPIIVQPEPAAKRARISAAESSEDPAADLISALRSVETDSRNGTLRTEADFSARFDSIARMLLFGAKIVIAGSRHKITEIEFFFCGNGHQDPYTSCDEAQRTCGMWHFHRTGGKYRGGTYKGLDLTMGGEGAHGAVLIRGLQEISSGVILDGPCVCVDHMLRLTGCTEVSQLVDRDPSACAIPASDAERHGRLVYIEYRRPHRVNRSPRSPASPVSPVSPHSISASASPVAGEAVPSPSVSLDARSPRAPAPSASAPSRASSKEILKTPRVGLTLKNYTESKERFVMKHYRYMTTIRETKKGKQFIVLALHKRLGRTAGEVHTDTGVGTGTVANYSDLFQKGRERANVNSLREVQLDTEELCELYGFCFEHGFI